MENFDAKHGFIDIYFEKVCSQVVFFCEQIFKTRSQLKIPKSWFTCRHELGTS